MNNLEIRLELKDNKIHHYELAEKIGISECTLSVWLRKPLSDIRKVRVNRALDEIKRGV